MRSIAIFLAAISTLPCLPIDAKSQLATPTSLRVELRARIDPESVGGHPFGRIASLALDRDGSVLVLDALSRSISTFNLSGQAVRSFGARGRGPGELEDPVAMFLGSDSIIWVADARLGRFTLFEHDGSPVGTRRAGGPPPFSPPTFGMDADGSLLFVGLDFERGTMEEPAVALVQASIGAASVQARKVTPLPSVRWPRVYRYSNPAVTLLIRVPFTPEPVFGLDPKGDLWFGSGAEGTVRRLDPVGGSWSRAVGADPGAVPVSNDDLDRALSGNRDIDELREAGGDAALNEFRALIPSTKPALSTMFFDDQGRMWLVHPSRLGPSQHHLRVFDVDGNPVGSLDVPLVANPRPFVRGHWLIGVSRDALDRETVLVYRIQSGAE